MSWAEVWALWFFSFLGFIATLGFIWVTVVMEDFKNL